MATQLTEDQAQEKFIIPESSSGPDMDGCFKTFESLLTPGYYQGDLVEFLDGQVHLIGVLLAFNDRNNSFLVSFVRGDEELLFEITRSEILAMLPF